MYESISGQFPLVLIPEELDWILKSSPKIPDEPYRPSEPVRESVSVIGFVVVIGPILFILSVVGAFPEEVTFGLWGVFAVYLVYQWISMGLAEDKAYDKRVENYKSQLAQYRKDQNDWKISVERIESPAALTKFRRESALNFFKGTQYPTKRSEGKRGKSEAYFESILQQNFPGLIFSGYTFSVPDDKRGFEPDFILQLQNGLHIDIEVDEYYSLDSGLPVHYHDDSGKSIDMLRNVYFCETNKWIVIRFAEVQVIEQAAECCAYIQSIIYDLTGLLIGNPELESLPIKAVKCWTYDEALAKSKQNYREGMTIPKVEQISVDGENNIILGEDEPRDLRGMPIIDVDDNLPF